MSLRLDLTLGSEDMVCLDSLKKLYVRIDVIGLLMANARLLSLGERYLQLGHHPARDVVL